VASVFIIAHIELFLISIRAVKSSEKTAGPERSVENLFAGQRAIVVVARVAILYSVLCSFLEQRQKILTSRRLGRRLIGGGTHTCTDTGRRSVQFGFRGTRLGRYSGGQEVGRQLNGTVVDPNRFCLLGE